MKYAEIRLVLCYLLVFSTSCTTWSRLSWSVEEQGGNVHFKVGSSYNLWWASLEIWFKIGWSVQGRIKMIAAKRSACIHWSTHHKFCHLKSSPDPHEYHLKGWLQASSFRKGENRVCDNREQLLKEHSASELDCTRNHLQYLFPKYKDYLSENHLLVWQFHFSVTWSSF